MKPAAVFATVVLLLSFFFFLRPHLENATGDTKGLPDEDEVINPTLTLKSQTQGDPLKNSAYPSPDFPTIKDGTMNTTLFLKRFAEEFSAADLNSTLWVKQVGPWKGGLNVAENVVLSEGFLKLYQNKDAAGHFTQGRINSRVFFGPGYYEARLRTSVYSGWHSAFWLTSLNFYAPPFQNQEFDVFELNSGNPSYWVTTLQAWSNGSDWNRRSKSLLSWKHNFSVWNTSQTFNVVGCYWSSQEVRIYYNGIQFLKVPWPKNLTCLNPIQVLFTTVIWPSSSHSLDSRSLGTSFDVDYLAHWILPGQESTSQCQPYTS